MLTKITAPKRTVSDAHFAIVASKYNEVYVNSMVRAAKGVLAAAKAKVVHVVRVPGAFEIPIVAAELANSDTRPYAAIICLGVILRGATTHAQHIGEAVSNSLMEIQVAHRVPVIHEVLLLENKEQAIERCLNPKHNRGAEAAYTAIEMVRVLTELRVEEKQISRTVFNEFMANAKARMEKAKRERT